jgi:tRNA nucleotidyltransferase (CCA-adding enzyme)
LRRDEAVYVVGGAVRDLLLGRTVRDLDLVVEGDAIGFARRLAHRLGASIRTHDRFGTATLSPADGRTLDVAAARSETYPRPGALPVVRLGATLAEDLARRDFTVHAMAIPLEGSRRRIDPFGGGEDLRRRRLRILHPGSFSDDPTRALRLARYASRLGFGVDTGTRRRLAETLDAGALETISADRLRREIRLLLQEANRAGTVRTLRALGLAGAIHPALRSRPGAGRRLRRAEAIAARGSSEFGWLCYLLAWMGEATAEEAGSLADRLGLAGDERRRVLAWPASLERIRALTSDHRISASRRAARGLSEDEVVAAATVVPSPAARRFLETVRCPETPLSIGGADLRAAGVPAGPRIGRALEKTREALAEGRIGRGEELEFALSCAREDAP